VLTRDADALAANLLPMIEAFAGAGDALTGLR